MDDIYFYVIPYLAARSVAFENGTVDILPGGSVENFDVPRLTELDNVCVTDREYFGPHSFLWLNNRSGPTSDPKMAEVMMHAMDRNFAKDVLWNGLGKVATGPVSSSTKFYSSEVTQYDYNPDKAKALLEEAGYDGSTVRILPLPYGETWQRWAEAVKQNFTDVGINAELVATHVAGWNQKLGDLGLRRRFHLPLSVR